MNLGVQCYIFATYSQRKIAVKFILNNINAIIFDLGGVILNLNPQNTFDYFAKISNFSDQKLQQISEYPFFKHYEMGEMTSDDFRTELRKIFGKEIGSNVIDAAWNAMLLDIPLKRLELIIALRPKFKTFVLSNTNDIHLIAFDEIVNKVTEGERIESYFDNVYYSCKVGMRKPDPKIFELVLSENKLNRSTTLFIDDTLEHIESAQKLGLQTWHLTNQEELFTVFGNE